MDTPEIETLLGALIAELLEHGALDSAEGIARRLDLAGMPDLANDVRAIPLVDAMASPASLRSGFEVLDGGNAGD